MSTIAAGTTSGTALVSTGNTDGTLQLQVNGTTPSVTLATSGAIGVGSTPGYGTSGQVLTSAGSAAAPTWATAAAPGMTFIANTTASGASSVNFTVSGYGTYLIQFYNVRGPTFGFATGYSLAARINNTTTSNIAYYGGGYQISGVGQVPRSNSSSTTSYIIMSTGDYAVFEASQTAMINGQMSFHNMDSTAVKYGSGFCAGYSNLSFQSITSFGASTAFATTTSYGAASSINLYMWDGTSTVTFSGTFVIYGLKTA